MIRHRSAKVVHEDQNACVGSHATQIQEAEHNDFDACLAAVEVERGGLCIDSQSRNGQGADPFESPKV